MKRWGALLGWLAVAGCLPGGVEPEVGDEPAVRDAWPLLDATNESVKELIACGGMQFAAMRALAAAVVRESGHPEAAEELFGRLDYTREDADYVMLVQGGVFTLRFGEGEAPPLLEEVFSLSSYVADPVLETPESIDAWMAGDIDFALHFSGPGPLFDLLDGGRGLQSPLRFQIEPFDVYGLAWANRLEGDLRELLGPLLEALAIESQLDFEDQRGDASIGYRMTTARMPVLALLDGGRIEMRLDYLEARSPRGLVLTTVEVDLAYLDPRALAGTIRYAFHDGDPDQPLCSALADYGDWAVYGDLSHDCD